MINEMSLIRDMVCETINIYLILFNIIRIKLDPNLDPNHILRIKLKPNVYPVQQLQVQYC